MHSEKCRAPESCGHVFCTFSSKFAMLYNDKSVLENYHVSSTFQLMVDDPELNILQAITKQEYKLVFTR